MERPMADAAAPADFHRGVLVGRRAGDQVAVLVVVGRHPVGRLPVPLRGVGRRHLRGKNLEGEHPGGGRVPGQGYRAILGEQDGRGHRPGRAACVAGREVEQQLGDVAEGDRDVPFMPAEHGFLGRGAQVAGVDRRVDDGRDRALGAVQQAATALFQSDRRDDLVPLADLPGRPSTPRDLSFRHADEPLALAFPQIGVRHGLDARRSSIANHRGILDAGTALAGASGQGLRPLPVMGFNEV
jgi:hypothetical protein